MGRGGHARDRARDGPRNLDGVSFFMPQRTSRRPGPGRTHRRRPSNRPRPAARSDRPARTSELERALDATVETTAALPVTFAGSGLPERLVAELTRRGLT